MDFIRFGRRLSSLWYSRWPNAVLGISNNMDQEVLPESFGLPDNALHVMQSNRVCAVLETGAIFCWSWEYD